MSIQTVTPHNERFADILSGLLFDVLKAAGINWQPTKSHERIRETGRKMALSIEYHSERKAIEVAKKLQTEVVNAFKAIETELGEVKERLDKLEKRIKKLEKSNKLEKRIEELEKSNNSPS